MGPSATGGEIVHTEKPGASLFPVGRYVPSLDLEFFLTVSEAEIDRFRGGEAETAVGGVSSGRGRLCICRCIHEALLKIEM